MARDTEVPVQAKGLRPAVRKEQGAKGQSYTLGGACRVKPPPMKPTHGLCPH